MEPEASATGFNETSPMQLAIRVPTINPIKTEMERKKSFSPDFDGNDDEDGNKGSD